MFYESVVAIAILFAVVCWGSRLRIADANRLNKLIRNASDVVGGGAGHFVSSVRQEDAVKGAGDTAVLLSSPPQGSGRIEEHLQPETDCSWMHP